MATDTNNQELYVGPRPFEYKDRKLFFGRDKESRDLLSIAIAHRALLIYAQSGAGKTSLINTRLIPDLEADGFDVLGIVRMQFPLKDETLAGVENVFIYKTLLNLAVNSDVDEELKRMTLAQYLKKREFTSDDDNYTKPRLIVFDQFEEIFTLHADRWEDRKGFFIQIRDAIEQSGKGNLKDVPPLWVVFVMREDYIANLDYYASYLPENLRIRYRLERLREDTAIQAIKGPLRDSHVSFDEGVAEDLVSELLEIRVETGSGESREFKGEYVEPVQLQLVCRGLLQNLPPDVSVIRRSHLEKFGDVDKTLTSFYDDAIQNAAEKAFILQSELRDWFENVLITPAGTRGTVYRGRVTTAKIPNEVVDILEGLHIIRAEIRSGSRWYEITHDRFIEPIKISNKKFKSEATGQFDIDKVSQQALQFYSQGERARDLENHKQAMEAFIEAKELYERIGDQRSLASTLVNIGDILFQGDEIDNAIERYEEALISFKVVDDKWGIVNTLSKIARVYDKKNDVDTAMQYRKDAVFEMIQAPGEARLLFERLKREDASFSGYEEELYTMQERYSSYFDSILTPNRKMYAAYDDIISWVLASMCQLVYDRFEEETLSRDLFIAKLSSGGFSLIDTFTSPETDIQAFLVIKKDAYAVLAFRGPEVLNWGDIESDTSVSGVSGIEKGVHGGFVGSYKSIEDQILKSIKKIGDLPLYITGHSLGGALAIVATQYFERDHTFSNQIAACYTFGSPRLGIGNFDGYLQSPIYRVVNRLDIVIVVPLLLMGYVHIGDMRYLGKRPGDIRHIIPFFQRMFLFYMAVFRLFRPLVRNHAIAEYRRKLEIIAQNRNPNLYRDASSGGKF